MDKQPALRILIIDDNPAIHEDFIKILTNNHSAEALNFFEEKLFSKQHTQETILPDFHIDTASHGEEGLRYIKQALKENRPYALAFVDVRMPPGWDGIETTKHIWKQDPNIQVVLCTAYSDYSWEETTKKLGMSDNLLILKKPFDNVAVRQLATALTKKWQLMRDAKVHTEFLENTVQERTHSLQQSLSLTRATLESSADAILVVDNDGKVIDFNHHFTQMWKLSASAVIKKNEQIIFKKILQQLKNPEEFLQKIKELHKTPEENSFDTINFKDGRVYERYSRPHKLDGAIVGRVWSFRDMTQRVYLETQLEHQATHDPLTDLPNRALLHDRIHQAIARAAHNKLTVGILFLDLDRFKLINDSLSHSMGDKLLIMVAQRLRTIIRKADTLARLGGDEFVVVLPDLKREENIIKIASNLLSNIQKPFNVLNREILITASVGISLYPGDGESPEELLRNADLAMYFSKESGSNQFQFYSKNMNQEALVRFEKESELRHAIENNEFFLCYQPQFDVIANKIVAVEALIRWQHPEKGLILPMDFIPIAEETGLISSIGEWVLRTACSQNKAWQDAGLDPIRVAVNITTHQLRQPDFLASISAILKETGLKPEYLELEVTENVIITSFRVVDVIKNLKELGVQIALDDFGVGNSSLNYLRKIPIDRLKIDKSFIQNIDLDQNDEIIMQAIIAKAHNLHLEVLAEGVETKEQLQFLSQKDCTDIQGFYMSRPLGAKECGTLLNKWQKGMKKA